MSSSKRPPPAFPAPTRGERVPSKAAPASLRDGPYPHGPFPVPVSMLIGERTPPVKAAPPCRSFHATGEVLISMPNGVGPPPVKAAPASMWNVPFPADPQPTCPVGPPPVKAPPPPCPVRCECIVDSNVVVALNLYWATGDFITQMRTDITTCIERYHRNLEAGRVRRDWGIQRAKGVPPEEYSYQLVWMDKGMLLEDGKKFYQYVNDHDMPVDKPVDFILCVVPNAGKRTVTEDTPWCCGSTMYIPERDRVIVIERSLA